MKMTKQCFYPEQEAKIGLDDDDDLPYFFQKCETFKSITHVILIEHSVLNVISLA